jgi:hypothetical protein
LVFANKQDIQGALKPAEIAKVLLVVFLKFILYICLYGSRIYNRSLRQLLLRFSNLTVVQLSVEPPDLVDIEIRQAAYFTNIVHSNPCSCCSSARAIFGILLCCDLVGVIF